MQDYFEGLIFDKIITFYYLCMSYIRISLVSLMENDNEGMHFFLVVLTSKPTHRDCDTGLKWPVFEPVPWGNMRTGIWIILDPILYFHIRWKLNR